jgi:hypothetical protein
MHKFIVAIGSVAFCVAAPAQQLLLQCVNPDVLNSLVFDARPESKLLLRREMPDNLAGFRAPAQFTLIGSGVRADGLSTTVAYRTALETQAALDSLVGFLSGEGWKGERMPEAQLPMANVAGSQPNNARLCRDGNRRNIVMQDIGAVRYATIYGFETTPARACDAPPAQSGFGVNPMASVNARQASLPRFSFPDTARMSSGSAGGLSLSGGNMASTATRIESPDSPERLARHLAGQLAEQGWRSGTEWSGKLSTGSTWSRSNADGQLLHGTLEILSLGEGAYDVGFSLLMRPQ